MADFPSIQIVADYDALVEGLNRYSAALERLNRQLPTYSQLAAFARANARAHREEAEALGEVNRQLERRIQLQVQLQGLLGGPGVRPPPVAGSAAPVGPGTPAVAPPPQAPPTAPSAPASPPQASPPSAPPPQGPPAPPPQPPTFPSPAPPPGPTPSPLGPAPQPVRPYPYAVGGFAGGTGAGTAATAMPPLSGMAGGTGAGTAATQKPGLAAQVEREAVGEAAGGEGAAAGAGGSFLSRFLGPLLGLATAIVPLGIHFLRPGADTAIERGLALSGLYRRGAGRRGATLLPYEAFRDEFRTVGQPYGYSVEEALGLAEQVAAGFGTRDLTPAWVEAYLRLARQFGLALPVVGQVAGTMGRLGVHLPLEGLVGQLIARGDMRGRETEVLGTWLALSQQVAARLPQAPDVAQLGGYLAAFNATGLPGFRGEAGLRLLQGVDQGIVQARGFAEMLQFAAFARGARERGEGPLDYFTFRERQAQGLMNRANLDDLVQQALRLGGGEPRRAAYWLEQMGLPLSYLQLEELTRRPELAQASPLAPTEETRPYLATPQLAEQLTPEERFRGVQVALENAVVRAGQQLLNPVRELGLGALTQLLNGVNSLVELVGRVLHAASPETPPALPPVQPAPAGTPEGALLGVVQPYEGVPYRYGGGHAPEELVPRGPEALRQRGIDCSAFVNQILAQLGVEGPLRGNWTTTEYARNGQRIAWSDLQPGDVLVRDDGAGGATAHMMLYLGHGQVAEAAADVGGVRIRPLPRRDVGYVPYRVPGAREAVQALARRQQAQQERARPAAGGPAVAPTGGAAPEGAPGVPVEAGAAEAPAVPLAGTLLPPAPRGAATAEGAPRAPEERGLLEAARAAPLPAAETVAPQNRGAGVLEAQLARQRAMPGLLAALDEAARAAGVPAAFLRALLAVENPQLDPTARSAMGALGLLQVMPEHFQRRGIPLEQATELTTNVRVAAEVAADAWRRSGGDPRLAARIYYSGRADRAYPEYEASVLRGLGLLARGADVASPPALAPPGPPPPAPAGEPAGPAATTAPPWAVAAGEAVALPPPAAPAAAGGPPRWAVQATAPREALVAFQGAPAGEERLRVSFAPARVVLDFGDGRTQTAWLEPVIEDLAAPGAGLAVGAAAAQVAGALPGAG